MTDRPGRDRRYALECEKIRALGWRPAHTFNAALEETVRWYQEHEAWWRPLKSGEFVDYCRLQYGNEIL